MALQGGHTYVIRNELTHTFLEITGNTDRGLFVMCWGQQRKHNQQWTLIAAQNKWKLQNRQRYYHQLRFLSPQLVDTEPQNKNYRLIGGVLPCEFVLEPIGTTETYRILYDGDDGEGRKAVSLVTGEEVLQIDPGDVVLDLHADGPPVALQPRAENDSAQIWTFHDMANDFPASQTLSLTIGRAYKIVNSKTGTVLDVTNTVGNPVHGVVSKGGDNHKWTVALNDGHYRLESSTVPNRFLALDVARDDLPGNRTALTVSQQPQLFLVRNVPGTRLYKIFLHYRTETLNDVSGLSVNLAVVDGEPDSVDGAVVRLQAGKAQGWYFIE